MTTKKVVTWKIGEPDPATNDPISGIVSVYYAVGGAVREPNIIGSMDEKWGLLAKGIWGEGDVKFSEKYSDCGVVSNVELDVQLEIMATESIVDFGEQYYAVTRTPPTTQNIGTKEIPLSPVEGGVRLSFLLWGRTRNRGVRQLYLPCVFLLGNPLPPIPFHEYRGGLNFRAFDKDHYGLPQWSYISQLAYFELTRAFPISMLEEIESRSRD